VRNFEVLTPTSFPRSRFKSRIPRPLYTHFPAFLCTSSTDLLVRCSCLDLHSVHPTALTPHVRHFDLSASRASRGRRLEGNGTVYVSLFLPRGRDSSLRRCEQLARTVFFGSFRRTCGDGQRTWRRRGHGRGCRGRVHGRCLAPGQGSVERILRFPSQHVGRACVVLVQFRFCIGSDVGSLMSPLLPACPPPSPLPVPWKDRPYGRRGYGSSGMRSPQGR